MSTALQYPIGEPIPALLIPAEPPEKCVPTTASDLGMAMSSPVASNDELPEEWERHRATVMTALAPGGDMETLAAEDAAHLLWRLERCRRYEVKAVRRADEGLEEELEAIVKNPTIARTRAEKVFAHRLKPFYDRRTAQRFREDPEAWEENEQTIRAEIAKMRQLRIIPNEQDSKENRAQEGFLRRAHKEAMAELRRCRKDRRLLEREKPEPRAKTRTPKTVAKTIPAIEPVHDPEPVSPNGFATMTAIPAKVQQAPEMAKPVTVQASQAGEAPSPVLPTNTHATAKIPCTLDPGPTQTLHSAAMQGQIQATVPAPIGSPGPTPIVQAPIIRRQEGQWVGLGGIPILYEKPKPPPPK